MGKIKPFGLVAVWLCWFGSVARLWSQLLTSYQAFSGCPVLAQVLKFGHRCSWHLPHIGADWYVLLGGSLELVGYCLAQQVGQSQL